MSGGYLLTRSDAEVVVGENAVGVIGPGDEPAGQRRSTSGSGPTGVAAGFGSVWVTNSADGPVSRIDPEQQRRSRSRSGPPRPGWRSGRARCGSPTPATPPCPGSTRRHRGPTTIPVRPGPTGVVVAFGSVWVTNALDASVTEIDPDTNEVVNVVPVGAGPTGIAAGAGYLWVTNQGDGTVTRFDPDTHVTDSPIKVGNGPVGIAFADGAAWVANNLDGSLSRIDVENLTVTSRTLDKDGGAYGVAAHDGDVWVSNEYAGTLMRVNADGSRSPTTVPLRGAPLGLAFVGDDLWFTSAQAAAPCTAAGS